MVNKVVKQREAERRAKPDTTTTGWNSWPPSVPRSTWPAQQRSPSSQDSKLRQKRHHRLDFWWKEEKGWKNLPRKSPRKKNARTVGSAWDHANMTRHQVTWEWVKGHALGIRKTNVCGMKTGPRLAWPVQDKIEPSSPCSQLRLRAGLCDHGCSWSPAARSLIWSALALFACLTCFWGGRPLCRGSSCLDRNPIFLGSPNPTHLALGVDCRAGGFLFQRTFRKSADIAPYLWLDSIAFGRGRRRWLPAVRNFSGSNRRRRSS